MTKLLSALALIVTFAGTSYADEQADQIIAKKAELTRLYMVTQNLKTVPSWGEVKAGLMNYATTMHVALKGVVIEENHLDHIPTWEEVESLNPKEANRVNKIMEKLNSLPQ